MSDVRARSFGPPGAKSMVYFIDDMNMPFVDKYDTQSAIEIVRQYVDYGGWYDKVKIVLKDIVNCQLVGAMNPTAGAFQITPRMQRHFVTFGIVVRAPSAFSQFRPGEPHTANQLSDPRAALACMLCPEQ
jgi:P-loop containing dynein motor region